MQPDTDYAVMELARRKIVELQAALDAKEPVTLSDSAVAGLREGAESILAQLTIAIEAQPVALTEVSKSLNAAVRQASKANTDHMKASARAMDSAIKQIAARQDADTRAIIDQVAELSRHNPTLIESLVSALKSMRQAASDTYQFDIHRDGNGYMKSVIAKPVPHGTRKAPEAAMESYS